MNRFKYPKQKFDPTNRKNTDQSPDIIIVGHTDHLCSVRVFAVNARDKYPITHRIGLLFGNDQKAKPYFSWNESKKDSINARPFLYSHLKRSKKHKIGLRFLVPQQKKKWARNACSLRTPLIKKIQKHFHLPVWTKKIARHERRAILSAAPCRNWENIKLIFTSKKHITKKRTQRSFWLWVLIWLG